MLKFRSNWYLIPTDFSTTNKYFLFVNSTQKVRETSVNRMAGIITGVVALVTAIIGLVIVDSVVSGTAFSTALLNTIAANVTTLAAVSILGLAGMWLYMKG